MPSKVVSYKNDNSGRRIEVSVLVPTDTFGGTGGDITNTSTYDDMHLINVGTPGTYYSVTTDAQGRVTSGSTTPVGDPSLIPSVSNTTGSTIATNNAVHLKDVSGTLSMELADSSSGNDKPVQGFTIASVANSATGSVKTFGPLTGFGGTIAAADAGVLFFHDPASPGGITKTATNTAGEKLQEVGYGAGSGTLFITIKEPIEQV